MKPEEALKILTSPLDEHQGSLEEVTKTIIQALEKQVPKKPVIATSAPSYSAGKNIYTKYKACGACGEAIADHWNGCPNCLTIIDWSVEE